MNFKALRAIAKYALLKRMSMIEDWTVQGFGFMRLRIDDNTRLHVWDSRLREPGVSDIHDHAQWAFRSLVLSGRIINVKFDITPDSGYPHWMSTITCGLGGGQPSQPVEVELSPQQPELYLPGDGYRQGAEEIHQTFPADGTVTIITQERRDTDTARVFWPKGLAWGDAIPRSARREEVDAVGAFALAMF
jgi:hypothetical protein